MVKGTGISEEFKDLLLRMFSFEPSKRPTIDELEHHPWLAKFTSSEAENTRA